MSLEEYKGVFVFAQQVDNELSGIAFELLGKAKDLAKDLDTDVTAVLVGSDVKGLVDDLAKYGADKVIVVDDPELKEYKRILIDDISNKGNVGLFFSEKNPDFNTIFKDGITKIATEFALHNGINRNEITESLIIYSDNSASLDSSKTPIIPYTPSSISDLIFALVEDVINPYYPSHVIRLYTEINEFLYIL